MDNILVSMNDNVLLPEQGDAFVPTEHPIFVQENVVQGSFEPSTVQVGITTTGDPYTDANVTNSGTPEHAVLNFTIPRGADGSDGVDGTDGVDGQAATIAVGTVTTGIAGSSASVTNSGTSSAAVFDFVIPRGDRGDQGIQGETGADGISPIAYVEQITGGARIVIEDSENTTTADVMNGQDGQAATVTVGSTTTGNAGTNASVVNSGTTSAAILDFTIPRGADGQNGQDGQDGSDGFSPIATVTQNTGSATISITDENGTTTATVYDGTDGTNGQDGQAATIAVGTVTTLPAGSSATVTNSGTSSAAVFDFGIPKGDTGAAGSTDWSDITNKPTFATVATSGSYNDLSNKPTIPTKTSDLTNDGSDGTSTYVEADDLATVATTGAYSDLTGTPTIPTVNNATLTIQKNGTNVATFTANSSTNETANISVPTSTSDLTNNSGFITNSDLQYHAGDSVTIGNSSGSGEARFFVSSGYVTSGTTTMAFNLPLAKSAVGRTASITSGTIWVRSTSGNYVINGASITNYSLTIVPLANNTLGVQLKNMNSAAFTGITNNTPFAISGYLTVSFS